MYSGRPHVAHAAPPTSVRKKKTHVVEVAGKTCGAGVGMESELGRQQD